MTAAKGAHRTYLHEGVWVEAAQVEDGVLVDGRLGIAPAVQECAVRTLRAPQLLSCLRYTAQTRNSRLTRSPSW
jgi:hypothetical protein